VPDHIDEADATLHTERTEVVGAILETIVDAVVR
jgi:hypothetical protein